MAERLREVWSDIDISDLLGQVRVVAHARGDAVVPFEEGRRVAAWIPDARFLPLDSRNHVLLAGEPAWATFLAELRGFVGAAADAGRTGPTIAADQLSVREREVIWLVAAGLTNEEIAARLTISVRTVERHLSNVYAKMRLSGKSARAAAAAWITEQNSDARLG